MDSPIDLGCQKTLHVTIPSPDGLDGVTYEQIKFTHPSLAAHNEFSVPLCYHVSKIRTVPSAYGLRCKTGYPTV
ncbi:hypothetical protein EG68_01227 [Paragonimus skrjabini miyazakii]|uniref:Uncharacterized protein n=1 Tax=Paragonimus skrjabini miyazakii TaxID=59628 RepID=A0A8S9Z6T9_9TREM|nr:hypothetical protein EG68_01227 [Paragonimus skrjabini miyazakii]